MDIIEMDKQRYVGEGRIPVFQLLFRCSQQGGLLSKLYKLLFIIARRERNIDLSIETKIGGGCFFGHASGITINPHTIIGKNVNIHKGVTIGQENRGERKGTPVIGDEVWIGINSTIVGAIHIGNDVLIAPNTFVNRDIPDHSIVFGNPCIIKRRNNATEGYINNKV